MRRILQGHSNGVRLVRHLVQDDGVVLLWALLMMFVLAITTAGTIQLVTTNEQAFGRDNRSTSALNIAEAGLNAGFAAIKAASDTTTTAAGNGSLDNGTWSYTASRVQNPLDSTKYTWTITSTGVLAGSTHVVLQKLAQTIVSGTQSQTQTTVTPASAAYGYGVFLGAGTTDCAVQSPTGPQNKLTGSGTLITTSTYVAGSLCLDGGATMQEPSTSAGGTLSLYVGGKLMTSNEAASVGTDHQAARECDSRRRLHRRQPHHRVEEEQRLAFAAVPCSQQGTALDLRDVLRLRLGRLRQQLLVDAEHDPDEADDRPELVLEREARARTTAATTRPTVPANQSSVSERLDRNLSSTRRSSTTTPPGIRAFRRAPHRRRTRSISTSGRSSTDPGAVMRQTASTAATTTRAGT